MSEPWGGKWTDVKLDVLGKYFQAFQSALKNKGFRTSYIDALAGDGKGNPQADMPLFLDDEDLKEAENLRVGAATLALKTVPSFDRYYLNERSQKKRAALEDLLPTLNIDANRVFVTAEDANTFVDAALKEISLSKDRGIILLDPFGMQVNWQTVEHIASTQRLDMWYLFPTMAVVRMLTKNGLPQQTWQDRLDVALGAGDWKSEFYPKEVRADFFENGYERTTRSADFASVEAFVVRRLSSIFEGTVIDKPLRLGPSKKPIFSLCFASGNPSEPARKLTAKLAKDILGTDLLF